MTDAKPVDHDEVERVFQALAREYEEQCGDYPKDLLFNVPDIPLPRKGTKARAVLDALRLAWSARARFVRARLAAGARARGQRVHAVEDERRDAALSSLEKALSLTQKAAALLAEDVEALNREARRFKGHADPALHDDVAKTEAMARGLQKLLKQLTNLRGIPQIRTQAEWDQFLSESAATLLDAGFTHRQTAALLTGQAPEEVDRSTMERFRQRARRLRVSDT